MKKHLIYLFVSAFSVISVQAQKITLKEDSISLKQAFKKLEAVSKYKIAYNDSQIDMSAIVTINQKDKDVLEVLSDLLKNTGHTYKINENYVIIIPKQKESLQTKKQVSGIILDMTGEPVIGANVVEKGTSKIGRAHV